MGSRIPRYSATLPAASTRLSPTLRVRCVQCLRFLKCLRFGGHNERTLAPTPGTFWEPHALYTPLLRQGLSYGRVHINLNDLGWDDEWARAFAPHAADGLLPARVAI